MVAFKWENNCNGNQIITLDDIMQVGNKDGEILSLIKIIESSFHLFLTNFSACFLISAFMDEVLTKGRETELEKFQVFRVDIGFKDWLVGVEISWFPCLLKILNTRGW